MRRGSVFASLFLASVLAAAPLAADGNSQSQDERIPLTPEQETQRDRLLKEVGCRTLFGYTVGCGDPERQAFLRENGFVVVVGSNGFKQTIPVELAEQKGFLPDREKTPDFCAPEPDSSI